MTVSNQLEQALQLSLRSESGWLAWENLENAEEWPSDLRTDSEDVTIANERDSDIESNAVLPLDRIELRRRTLGPDE